MGTSTRQDHDEVPAWERELREDSMGRQHIGHVFTAEHFPRLAAALHVTAGQSLEQRVVNSVDALDRDLATSPLWDEYRRLLYAACAWWGISEAWPTREDWQAFCVFADLAESRKGAMERERRSFRHAWAAHEYQAKREQITDPFPLTSTHHHDGHREPFKTQIQDAFVALLLALVDGGDGIEFWDPRSNRLLREPLPTAEQEQTKPAVPSAPDPAQPVTSAVRAFYERVRTLEARIIPRLLKEADQVAGELEMSAPTSWSEFGRRLTLLTNIRDTLERLTPAVFEASLPTLMSMTTPIGGDALIDSHAKHTRLLTERYVRPWVKLSPVQLSNTVALVIRARREWQELASQAVPTVVPLGLDDLRLAWSAAGAQLEEIDRVIGLQGDSRLGQRTISDLRAALERISATEPS
ncbi:hypothetical protein [Microbacterium sp.]|uniref:hypothetical protein n=1 Tax=Microbacterium sp. TaxID=51671 RepID=UPI0039E58C78